MAPLLAHLVHSVKNANSACKTDRQGELIPMVMVVIPICMLIVSRFQLNYYGWFIFVPLPRDLDPIPIGNFIPIVISTLESTVDLYRPIANIALYHAIAIQ